MKVPGVIGPASCDRTRAPHLPAFVVVWEEAEAREASAGERLSRVGMLRTLEEGSHITWMMKHLSLILGRLAGVPVSQVGCCR